MHPPPSVVPHAEDKLQVDRSFSHQIGVSLTQGAPHLDGPRMSSKGTEQNCSFSLIRPIPTSNPVPRATVSAAFISPCECWSLTPDRHCQLTTAGKRIIPNHYVLHENTPVFVTFPLSSPNYIPLLHLVLTLLWQGLCFPHECTAPGTTEPLCLARTPGCQT